jgi:arginase
MLRPARTASTLLRRSRRTAAAAAASSSSLSPPPPPPPPPSNLHQPHHPPPGTAGAGGGGIGLHNVHDQILPSVIPSHRSMLHQCSIIGVPMTHGQPYVGTDDGPELLRNSGLVDQLRSLSWQVNDLGDLILPQIVVSGGEEEKEKEEAERVVITNSPPSMTIMRVKNAESVGAGTHLLAQTLYEQLQQGDDGSGSGTSTTFPLILGGDHSIAIGSLAALLRHNPETGIIWIDAHADINTPWISQSGNLHGMPIGLLLDPMLASTIPGFGWLKEFCPTPLQPRQIAYVGLRDVDAAERRIILDHKIAAYTMHEIDRYGIGYVMDRVLNDHLRDRPLHMSYDIDAIDPILAPATGTTVRGGLTFREAHYVAEAAAPRLRSAEIVELNPTRAPNSEGADNTIELGLQIISSMMGKSII